MLALEVKVLAGMLIKLQSSALVAVLTVGRSVGRSRFVARRWHQRSPDERNTASINESVHSCCTGVAPTEVHTCFYPSVRPSCCPCMSFIHLPICLPACLSVCPSDRPFLLLFQMFPSLIWFPSFPLNINTVYSIHTTTCPLYTHIYYFCHLFCGIHCLSILYKVLSKCEFVVTTLKLQEMLFETWNKWFSGLSDVFCTAIRAY